MFGLTDAARTLMQTPLPSGMGTFGPSFKFISDVSTLAPSLSGKAPPVAKSIPSQRDDSGSTQDLSTAVQDLTKVAESLATSAQQIMQAMQMIVEHGPASGVGEENATTAPAATINAWEDDPFSQKTPTATPGLATPIQVPVPNNTQPLKFKIVDPAVRPDEYDPGTPQFRFWGSVRRRLRAVLASGIRCCLREPFGRHFNHRCRFIWFSAKTSTRTILAPIWAAVLSG